MNDEKIKGKLTDEEKKKVTDKVEEIIKWLEVNPQAEAEAYKEKTKELEAVFHPLASKLYQG